jgi:hypothetical protein
MRAILFAIATVAKCLRLRDVRSISHVLRPVIASPSAAELSALPAPKAFADICFRACWSRSASACRRWSVRRVLPPARQRIRGPFLNAAPLPIAAILAVAVNGRRRQDSISLAICRISLSDSRSVYPDTESPTAVVRVAFAMHPRACCRGLPESLAATLRHAGVPFA